jgi:hypothetical protein
LKWPAQARLILEWPILATPTFRFPARSVYFYAHESGVLFDEPTVWQILLPFTFPRPVAGLRVGILTIAEKWQRYLGLTPSFDAPEYLRKKFPLPVSTDNLWIHGALCPHPALVARIRQMASTEKKGTKVLGLLEAVEELGFQAKGVRGETASLLRIPKPAIGHIIIKEVLQHYVVIYAATEKHIDVMDPGTSQMYKPGIGIRKKF